MSPLEKTSEFELQVNGSTIILCEVDKQKATWEHAWILWGGDRLQFTTFEPEKIKLALQKALETT